MQTLAAISKILGSLFYYPLTHQNNQALIQSLNADEAIANSELEPLLQALTEADKLQLNTDFLNLFEGAGVMPAPPWGSVYLDKQEVIFGDSLLEYREFLQQADINLDTGMREPEDQFGLMLLALAQLIENNASTEQVNALLEQHLLPWAPRYLELMQTNAGSTAYQLLAQTAANWLEDVVQEYQLAPAKRKLYR